MNRTRSVVSWVRAVRRAAVRAEDGGLLPFTIMIFIGMVLVTGMAVDMMRHETHRADMQNALDRGLLAATDLDLDLTDEEAIALVHEYFDTAQWVGEGADLDVTVPVNDSESDGTGVRRLEANADFTLDTAFLRIIGRPTMPVLVRGGSLEERRSVELSLVLDISGSMRWCLNDNGCSAGQENRIELLIPAAQEFVDQIVKNDAAETTSINLVPYAGQVNVGPQLFSALGGQRVYLEDGGMTFPGNEDADYADASCLELTTNDFLSSGLPSAGSYAQVPNFHHWNIAWDWMSWGWCPADSVAITIMNGVEDQSLAAQTIKNRIESLRTTLHDGTGTSVGMKYGLALLDPASRDTLAPYVPDIFSGVRPVAWEDEDTIKVIVLMTDGNYTPQHRPTDPANELLATEEVTSKGELTSYQLFTESEARAQFLSLCTQAKQNNVLVFTIAYDVNNTGLEQDMKDCATSAEAHYYKVQGLEIEEAFKEIATTLEKVKLTQ